MERAKTMTEKQYRRADRMVFISFLVVIIGIFLNMLGMASSALSNRTLIPTIAAPLGVFANCVIWYSKETNTNAHQENMLDNAMAFLLAHIVWFLFGLFRFFAHKQLLSYYAYIITYLRDSSNTRNGGIRYYH